MAAHIHCHKTKVRLVKRREAARKQAGGEGMFKGFGIREYGMIRTAACLQSAQQTAVTRGSKAVAVAVVIKWKVSPLCPSCVRLGQILYRCQECHGSGKSTLKRKGRS